MHKVELFIASLEKKSPYLAPGMTGDSGVNSWQDKEEWVK